MDSINKAASATGKMIWGENKQKDSTEPPSGETGRGTASDPYDAGNATEDTNPSTTTTTSSSSNTADTSATNTTGPITTTSGEDPNATKTTGAGMTGPTVGAAAPESGAAPAQKQQGADRPVDEPSGEGEAAIREKKDEAESAMRKDPDDHSGEPLDKSAGAGGSDQKQSMGSTSKEGGTGEKYIKSTGTAADGGDFDATKPGAGREADRLLEEKGVHREGNVGPLEETPGESSASKADKPSVGQKIKEKLHMGK